MFSINNERKEFIGSKKNIEKWREALKLEKDDRKNKETYC